MSSPSFLNDFAARICTTDVLPPSPTPTTHPTSTEHAIGDPGTQPAYTTNCSSKAPVLVQPRGPRALNLRSSISEYAQHDPGTGFFPASRICPKIRAETMKHGLSALPLASVAGGERSKVLYIAASLEGHSTGTKGLGETPRAGTRQESGAVVYLHSPA